MTSSARMDQVAPQRVFVAREGAVEAQPLTMTALVGNALRGLADKPVTKIQETFVKNLREAVRTIELLQSRENMLLRLATYDRDTSIRSAEGPMPLADIIKAFAQNYISRSLDMQRLRTSVEYHVALGNQEARGNQLRSCCNIL